MADMGTVISSLILYRLAEARFLGGALGFLRALRVPESGHWYRHMLLKS